MPIHRRHRTPFTATSALRSGGFLPRLAISYPFAMLITLTTDFGLQDCFVGIMKGVIAGINSAAEVVDLTHGIPAQDVMAGALTLRHSIEYFPRGTIHVAVVDPGSVVRAGPF